MVETQTDSVQFAWGAEILNDHNDLQVEEYEKLIELVFNEIKKEYKDDEYILKKLCKKLLNQGHYVICLDNNFTGSMDNIQHIKIYSKHIKYL